MNRTVFFSFFVLLTAAITVSAQNSTPKEVVERYYRFLEREDWKSATDLTHPEAMEEVIDIFKMLSTTNDATRESLAESFGGAFSIDTLDRVDPRVVYTVFLKEFMGGLDRAIPEDLKDSEIEVIGAVKEGDDLAHVVYRMATDLDAAVVEKMMVQTVKLHDGRWLLLSRDEIASIKIMLPMLLKLSKSFKNMGEDEGIEWQDDWNEEGAETE